MKDNKKIAIISIVLIAIAIVTIVVVSNSIKSKTIKEEYKTIKEEYSKAIDAKIEEYLSGDDREEADEMGLTDISYELTKIEKDDGNNLLSVSIYITTDGREDWETAQELLAYEVEEECFKLAEGQKDEFYLGKYRCSYRAGSWHDYAFDELITTYVDGNKIHYPEILDTSSSKDTVKCEVCGKKYNKGSDNAKSISRTNMCSRCYSNFKWTQDAIKEMPVD